MRCKVGWQPDFCFPAPVQITTPLPSAFLQVEIAKRILEGVIRKARFKLVI